MSELEWQCHNWYHFTWLSGDQICEQHIHNIDVMNWCFNGPPAKFTAVGGRGWRTYNEDQIKTAKEVCRKLNNGSEPTGRNTTATSGTTSMPSSSIPTGPDA